MFLASSAKSIDETLKNLVDKTDIRYNLSASLSAAFLSDRLSSRFNLDW
ncbi:hypothetical protein [Nostoc sp.]